MNVKSRPRLPIPDEDPYSVAGNARITDASDSSGYSNSSGVGSGGSNGGGGGHVMNDGGGGKCTTYFLSLSIYIHATSKNACKLPSNTLYRSFFSPYFSYARRSCNRFIDGNARRRRAILSNGTDDDEKE